MSDREFSERKPRREGPRAASGASSGSREGTRKPRPSGVTGGRRDENFVSGRARQADSGADRPDWQSRVARPIDPEREKSPLIPEEITEKDLEIGVRVQLKTLTAENAEMVARHLAMVGLLIEQDPELAHKHALAAARRAGRIAVVRETVGITAYHVGDFALAMRELLTHRRISGSNEQLPLIVDCERGLGRPDRALEVGRSVDRNKFAPAIRVNLEIEMSGVRLDRGETDLAIAELEIRELDPSKVFDYSPDLFRAYGESLSDSARKSESARWFELADRAESALLKQAGIDEDEVSVMEEIHIPQPSDRPKREYSSHGDDQKREFGSRNERERREFGSREDRPKREFGSREDRPKREFGSREDRPKRDFGDRGDSGPRGSAPRGPIKPTGKGPKRER